MAASARAGGPVARLVAVVVGYVVLVLVVVAVVVWAALPSARRSELAGLVAPSAPVALLVLAVALGGLGALLVRLVGGWPAAARRMTGDVRVVLGANPAHRVSGDGPAELVALAGAVDELAARRLEAERAAEREAAAARAQVEQERNRLAALMADLTVAVLVCSRGGRVLLYNAAARDLLGEDPALGLGRSVFGLVDRDLITHALDRLDDGSAEAHVSALLRDGRLLRVRVTPVPGEPEIAGFVLVLEDTTHLEARRRRDATLRALTEGTRSSAASLRAAVEAVRDYPDMAADERGQFLAIAAEEAQRLGGQVDAWAAHAASLGSDWLLADLSAADLVAVLRREVERAAGVCLVPGAAAAGLWLRVDSHALARALAHLVGRLGAACGVAEVAAGVVEVGAHGRLELSWRGAVPDAQQLKRWLDEPLAGGVGGTAGEVVERHDAQLWIGSDGEQGGHLRLLLPATPAPAERPVRARAALASRPEFYDFDLFDLGEESAGWQDRRLAELAYTVLDTETTGFSPAAGDEIVALGAVRVVGGRVRAHETFDRLVDPGRPVPAAATAVHGITDETLRGQPPVEQVLPVFARFAEGTVLVGHNVGFDLSFLRAGEARTGVRLTQPVLDTLLLDAAVHPDHDAHSLEAIAARLGIDVIGRHTALGDALLTAEVFVRLLALLDARGITTLGEALAAAQATYAARLDAKLYGG